jgi:hypothetical protein
MANFFAVANAPPAGLVLGLANEAVNRLVDVARAQEATWLVARGWTMAEDPPAPPVKALDLPTRQLPAQQVNHAAIAEMHSASTRESGAAAAA